MAAAAVLIVILVHTPNQPGEGEFLLRGPLEEAMFAASSALQADGSVLFQWMAVPEAEGYRILFYNQDLDEIARMETGRATTLQLPPDSLTRLASSGPTLFWRVAALHGSEARHLSSPRTLSLP
jgi:hypothetical protein